MLVVGIHDAVFSKSCLVREQQGKQERMVSDTLHQDFRIKLRTPWGNLLEVGLAPAGCKDTVGPHGGLTCATCSVAAIMHVLVPGCSAASFSILLSCSS